MEEKATPILLKTYIEHGGDVSMLFMRVSEIRDIHLWAVTDNSETPYERREKPMEFPDTEDGRISQRIYDLTLWDILVHGDSLHTLATKKNPKNNPPNYNTDM